MTSIPAWAVKGARVVCVKDFRRSVRVRDLGFRGLPEVNAVYEIHGVEYWPEYSAVTLMLVGFPEEQGFDVVGFRPVKTIEDDISEHFAIYLKTPVRTSIRAGERA